MFVEQSLIFLVSNAEFLQEKVGELNDLLHFLVSLSKKRERINQSHNRHMSKDQYVLYRILHHT